jgi:hypothetical protein
MAFPGTFDGNVSVRRMNTNKGSEFPDWFKECKITTDGGVTWTRALQDDFPAMWNVSLNHLYSADNSDPTPQVGYGRYTGKSIYIPGSGVKDIPAGGMYASPYSIDLQTGADVQVEIDSEPVIYMLGGGKASGEEVYTVFSFNLVTKVLRDDHTPIPLAYQDAGVPICVAAVGTDIYALLCDESGPTTYFLKYDTAEDTWTALTAPTARIACSMFSDGTDVYLWGGANASYAFVNTLEKYSISGGSWSSLTAGGTARLSAGAFYYDGNVYICGGLNSGFTSVGTVDIYDISGDSWSTGSTATVGQTAHVVVGDSDNGLIYSFGGYTTGDSGVVTLQIYDISGDSWSDGEDAPYGIRGGSGGIDANGDLFVFAGGYLTTTPTDWFMKYDASENSWETLEEMEIKSVFARVDSDGDPELVLIPGVEPYRGEHGLLCWEQDENTIFLGKVASAAVGDHDENQRGVFDVKDQRLVRNFYNKMPKQLGKGCPFVGYVVPDYYTNTVPAKIHGGEPTFDIDVLMLDEERLLFNVKANPYMPGTATVVIIAIAAGDGIQDYQDDSMSMVGVTTSFDDMRGVFQHGMNIRIPKGKNVVGLWSWANGTYKITFMRAETAVSPSGHHFPATTEYTTMIEV